MNLPLHIQHLKQRIWETAKHNLYTIIVCKVNINWDFTRDREGDYNALLKEVERLCIFTKQWSEVKP